MTKSHAKAGVSEVEETLNKSEAFIQKNKKALIGAFIGLLVIIVGFILFNNMQDSRSKEAATALANAQELISQQQFEQALKGNGPASPGLLQIVSDYGGTKPGNLAKYYTGICYAKMNKWQEAVQYLEDFKPQDDLLASPLSQVALGDAYANIKQYDKAVEAFKKAASLADKAAEGGLNMSVSPLALKKAGIILNEQGKKEDAQKTFEEIKTKYVNATLTTSGEIDKYIEFVKK